MLFSLLFQSVSVWILTPSCSCQQVACKPNRARSILFSSKLKLARCKLQVASCIALPGSCQLKLKIACCKLPCTLLAARSSCRAKDKSTGSLAFLVSDVLTHWVRTCSMSSTGRDDVDDTQVYCHRRTSPLSLWRNTIIQIWPQNIHFGRFQRHFGASYGPPKVSFAQMGHTIAVGIENYYTGPT